MSDFGSLNSIEWHDGIFLGWQVDFNDSACISMDFRLYPDPEGKERKNVKAIFSGITSLHSSIDAIELLDNRRAGNVSNAYIKKDGGRGKYKFFLYLVDGLITLSFRDFVLEIGK
ncbi:hypothetical protein [Paraburkholderia lycopersici]|uniref:Immunity protein 50 n=1 Tax=Paraburkholderia lycopersici TaxID=416944 RepID=A0A1G6KVG4_9BURK|nr:hypothetical protein [Paraburkholderia lycopersici]SDC34954.1 hypothetical protein SAMN05421548_1063 [Paraburkholderia lycopersici]